VCVCVCVRGVRVVFVGFLFQIHKQNNYRPATPNMMLVVSFFLSLTQSITPIEKVVNLLEDLQEQVINEGKAEAQTYDKFACFCKDNSKEKTAAITESETQKSTYEAELQELQATRTEEITKKSDAAVKIVEVNQEIERERETRQEVHNKYAEAILDLEKAIQSAAEAEKLIKASNSGPALLNLKRTVNRAVLMAKALGSPVNTALLEEPFDPETEDYSFHSNDVLEILKKLHGEFIEQKNTLDKEEIAAKKAYDELIQGKQDEKENQKQTLADADSKIQKKTADIGKTQAQFSEVSTKLFDDQAFLKELTSNCNAKAETWDKRTKARSAELSALHQATTIIKDKVQTIGQGSSGGEPPADDASVAPPGEKLPGFIQNNDMRKKKTFAFIQTFQSALIRPHSSHRFLAASSALSKVAALLRSKSESEVLLKNSTLLRFAARAAESDPMDKVKTLIQELIERLQAEAANEQEHNNWCTGETKKATQTRDIKVKEIKTYNQELAKGEANRDQLKEELKTLRKELDDLNKALEKAQTLRDQESAENAKAISDAEAGQQAVAEATTVLTQYYDAAAQGTVSLLRKQAPPDAGFGNDEAYTGAQDAAVGVLGMLDVIKSDFIRQKDQTELDEKTAKAEFEEFKSTSDASIASKKKQEDKKTADSTELESKITTNKENLNGSQKLFDGAIKELLQLHEACVATGQTHEERAAAREEEIAALKDALTILEKQGPR